MRLHDAVETYIAFKRSLGMRLCSEAGVLRAFCRAVGEIDVTDVTPEAVLAFVAGPGPVTAGWKQKASVLRSFYRYAVGRGFAATSPLPTILPKFPPSKPPYIYSTAELKRLLVVLQTPRAPLQALVFRTLLLLLYGTGMRIGEALSLTSHDVDLVDHLITVRDAKFFKTRLVPTGPRLTQELAAYACRRQQLPMPAGQASAFFAIGSGKPWHCAAIEELFRRVRKFAGVERQERARYQPRLYDIRPTAAQHRLIAWYRAGADVQRLLPQLATYLGHVNLESTQYYLSMTPELLQEASQRFEHYAQHDRTLIGPWIGRFLLEYLVAERNLARNTQASYRDTLVRLLPFIARATKRPVDRLSVEDLSSRVVRRFLEHIEKDRGCSGATRNLASEPFIRSPNSSARTARNTSAGARKYGPCPSRRPPRPP
jgi:integrase/recombinase XerD